MNIIMMSLLAKKNFSHARVCDFFLPNTDEHWVQLPMRDVGRPWFTLDPDEPMMCYLFVFFLQGF